MAVIVLLAICLAVAAPGMGADLGRRPAAKVGGGSASSLPLGGERQGGETIETALVVAELPFQDTGTTTGFADDYDEECPAVFGESPDVVYAYTAPADMFLEVDLCHSSYDTRIWIYDAARQVIACNDDGYPDGDPCGGLTSRIAGVRLAGGETYHLIIDGFHLDAGNYQLAMSVFVPCELFPPSGSLAEGEPPVEDGYLDAYNGGCNSPQFGNPMRTLHGDATGARILAGRSGWYGDEYQNPCRDTDWFRVYAAGSHPVVAHLDAEAPTYVADLYPLDCAAVDIAQYFLGGPCHASGGTFYWHPGEPHWLWVAPVEFYSPYPYGENEYDYVLWLSGLVPSVPVETMTWSAVKVLFR